MMNTHTAAKLLNSMSAHKDVNRLISDCYENAYRIVEIGYEDTTTELIFHFADSSRVEFYPEEELIRIACP